MVQPGLVEELSTRLRSADAYNLPMADILNISTYRFVAIDDPQALQHQLKARALDLDLKGTILISPEGINLFLAGLGSHVQAFMKALREDPRFADLPTKDSWSDHIPFRKMLVKVKAEIIRMNEPAIRPQQGRAPAITPQVAKQWLDRGVDDQGRPVVILDTRNDFEVGHGGFHNAINWHLSKFSEFPQAVREHASELADKTVITYCTGGIRCEKAALFMRDLGLDHVYQIDGGILKYFEEVGTAHYEGQCFVFDEREALGVDLSPHPITC